MSETSTLRQRIIDNDSDSDDDVPLAKLRKPSVKVEAGVATPIVKQEPIATENLKGNNQSSVPASSSVAIKKEIKQEESDSDDDIPISGLAQRKKIKAEPSAKITAAPKARPTRVSTVPASTSQRKSKKRIKIKYKQQECTDELYGTLKGRLTQELLCRWWYAVVWPPIDENTEKMHGVQELDGFRGAYIRVKGDEMGTILDTRTAVGKPSFLHFFAMPSAEILKLLLTAYKKQIEALIEHEGEDAPMLKELRAAASSAAKISPEKADRSVTKILKSYPELAAQLKEIQERHENSMATEEEEDDDGNEKKS